MMGYGITRKPKNMGQAIRFFCLECMGGYDEHKTSKGKTEEAYMPFGAVKDCPDQNCQLYPYRFGKCPARSRAAKARALGSAPDTPMVLQGVLLASESPRTRRKPKKVAEPV